MSDNGEPQSEDAVSTHRAEEEAGGAREAGLAMALKLLLAAEKRWRRVNAPRLVALVKAGVTFRNGEAAMFQPEKLVDSLPFSQAPSILAVSQMLIHSI